MTPFPCRAARILLIIGGGIAAYKSLEADPAAPRPRRSSSRRDDGGGPPIHYAPVGRDPQRAAGARRPFQPDGRGADRPYRVSRAADLVVVAPATANLLARMAGGSGRRSGDHLAAGDRQARPGRPGDERQNVAASGDPAQCRAPQGRRRSVCRARIRGRWPAANSVQAAWPSLRRSSRRSSRRSPSERTSVIRAESAPAAHRTACHRHFRPDL